VYTADPNDPLDERKAALIRAAIAYVVNSPLHSGIVTILIKSGEVKGVRPQVELTEAGHNLDWLRKHTRFE
jgi:hypothetical protein